MSRLDLQRAAPGYRTVRGEAVRRMQLALKHAGSGPKEIDGIFGAVPGDCRDSVMIAISTVRGKKETFL
jgi:hypothetical protein